jgi:hypothetical protein
MGYQWVDCYPVVRHSSRTRDQYGLTKVFYPPSAEPTTRKEAAKNLPRHSVPLFPAHLDDQWRIASVSPLRAVTSSTAYDGGLSFRPRCITDDAGKSGS